jgi:hypothetical protein
MSAHRIRDASVFTAPGRTRLGDVRRLGLGALTVVHVRYDPAAGSSAATIAAAMNVPYRSTGQLRATTSSS